MPEGQYTQAAREKLVKEVTEAMMQADGGTFEDVAPRVWVNATEVPDGGWGSRGVIRRGARDPGVHRLASMSERLARSGLRRRRRVEALELLEGALDAVRQGTVG